MPLVTLSSGCSLFGYDYLDAADASEDGLEGDAGAPNDAGDGGTDADANDRRSASDAGDGSTGLDASDSGSELDASDDDGDASDGSRDPDASLDAAGDGAALDASDGSRDAAGDVGLPDAAPDASRDAGGDASTDAAASQCDGGVCPPRCNLTGTYALKLSVPTTWPTSGQLSSGSGTFEFRLKLRATQVDNQATIQLRECGQKVPAIHASLANEDHLFTYPDSLFDSERLRSSSSTITLGDSTASSSMSLPPVAMEMGVDLADPLNDAWPTTASGLPDSVRVDVEPDNNPSVTAVYSNANGYMYPRTSTAIISPQRAQQVYIAVRWIFSLSGMLTSCDGAKGDATLSKLDSRMVGCRHADGMPCVASESNHLDSNLPKYRFGAGSYVLSRVADNAACSVVRAVP